MRIVTVIVVGLLFLVVSDTSAQLLQKQLESESIEQLVADAQRLGDPVRGAAAFYLPEMNCAKCHVANSNGRQLGPNLAEKREVRYDHLINSVLKPSDKIKEGYETAVIQMEDGDLLTGVLIEVTDESITIDQIEQPEKPLVISLEDVEDWRKSKVSSMPEQLANQLTDRRQFLDLVRYLKEIADGGAAREEQLKPALLAANVPLPEYESRIDHRTLISELNNRSFRRGEEIFKLRCASCHGTLDEEGSMPTSLRFAAGGKFKHGNDPYTMYRTLTHGFGMMNAQRWMVPRQKYDVVHYVREQFLKPHNTTQYFDVTEKYLAGLPVGDTLGPEPVVSKPWSEMDYGPSMSGTIEVSRDGSNIAQKGIAIRLDAGPGGVESGKYWAMYEHDTMRLAAAWSEGFINYEGIHFNGMHGRHPKITGRVEIENPVGPGWGRPVDQSFVDDRRVVGRDGRQYGPLPKDWSKFKGMYRFGKQTILEYTVGDTRILESPGLKFVDDRLVYLRHFNVDARNSELMLQIAQARKGQSIQINDAGALISSDKDESPTESDAKQLLQFDGKRFVQTDATADFDMHEKDFTICAKIKTSHNGTIFAQTKDQDEWVKGGKSFFIRDQRLCFDIGWVGAVIADQPLPINKWTTVAVTWRASDSRIDFFVDGKNVGGDRLPSELNVKKTVQRIGFTNKDFPEPSFFKGQMEFVRFYQRQLKPEELNSIDQVDEALVGFWKLTSDTKIKDNSASGHGGKVRSSGEASVDSNIGLFVSTSNKLEGLKFSVADNNLRMTIPAGKQLRFTLQQLVTPLVTAAGKTDTTRFADLADSPTPNLQQLTKGGPQNWPQTLKTKWIRGQNKTGFRVDVLTRPVENPWNDRLRLTGIDFLPGTKHRDAIVSTWDGSIWRVKGIDEASTDKSETIEWQRIAAGLFQPLGVKIRDGQIFVICRDQIVRLHDLNGDQEIDWYECFNSDHQVTEHFHEFAMGLQSDEEGNFYYAKSARHAKKAVVPHHGTLLKVSANGADTEIVANGFRAANGVCINPDGTFIVTDQEGHWNPKNRINWVSKGGFYGNMFGYHDITDSSDEAMDDPLCWITNNFDRSPGELLWVDSKKWGPLNGSLLNFSYGFGQVYIVPHERVGDQFQGGMCALPMPRFPTGVMRGRFHPVDGQLYCCGMFAWSGTQQQPGGLYRINYTDEGVHLPIGLSAKKNRMEIAFSGKVDFESAADAANYAVEIWDLKRTKNYGSKHFNQTRLAVEKAEVQSDGQTVSLTIPGIKPTWGMEIVYTIKTEDGEELKGKIHSTIHVLNN